ncbi:MAG: rhomboid family intramembrane serine protease [Desulfohalobiaceae bacterium]|nr:rhomboid family intramembrane serine protease [Desulfohalobiaceae bacterium]
MFPIKDYIPRRHTPIALWLILGLNAVVFIFELSLTQAQLEQLFHILGVVPARYFRPEWAELVGYPSAGFLPFVSHMFLHSGVFHFAVNMWILVVFADNIEDVMGPLRFVIFYLCCGLLALAGHMFFFSQSTVPVVGASGAIAGMMGSYMRLYPQAQVLTLIPVFIFPLFLNLPAVLFLGLWFLLQFSSGVAATVGAQGAGGVAWWAHAFGFVAGLLLIPLFKVDARCYYCHPRKGKDDFRFM